MVTLFEEYQTILKQWDIWK